jgi:hypothetical protein
MALARRKNLALSSAIGEIIVPARAAPGRPRASGSVRWQHGRAANLAALVRERPPSARAGTLRVCPVSGSAEPTSVPSEERPIWRNARPWLEIVPVLVPITLFGPMALHWSAFAIDWGNHLFLVATMEHSIRTLGHPSYFLHSSETGLYFPFFAFYGGTLYTLGGLLSIVMGSPVRAYVASYALCFIATYGGMYWISRLTRLRGLLAHVPAIVTVTGAYYLTDAYARGAWPEFVAVSVMPLLIASIVHVLARPQVRVLPMIALYFSAVVFSGSHNITLLWGTIVLVLAGLVGAIAVGARVVRARASRVGLVAALIVLAGGTNAWFLLPDVVYTGKTVISRAPHVQYLEFDKASVVFNPWRVTGLPEAPTLFVQVSVYVLAWSLVVLVIAALMRVGDRRARIFTAGLVTIGAALLILTVFDSLWDHMPKTLLFIQFPYRLESYILLLTAGVSLLAVHAALRLPHQRVVLGFLAVAVTCQVGLAERQVWTAGHNGSGSMFASYAGTGHVPPTWYGVNEYRVASGRLVTPTATFNFPTDLVRDDRLAVAMPTAPGDYETNVVASPFVGASGAATDVGYSPNVLLVVRRTGNEPKHALVALQPKIPTAELIGVVLSVVSTVGFVGLSFAVWWGARRSRRRRVAGEAT